MHPCDPTRRTLGDGARAAACALADGVGVAGALQHGLPRRLLGGKHARNRVVDDCGRCDLDWRLHRSFPRAEAAARHFACSAAGSFIRVPRVARLASAQSALRCMATQR
jgi:hypothetical protein